MKFLLYVLIYFLWSVSAAESQILPADSLKHGDGVTLRNGYLDMHGIDPDFVLKPFFIIPAAGQVTITARREIIGTGDFESPLLVVDSVSYEIVSDEWVSYVVQAGESGLRAEFANDQWTRGQIDVNLHIRDIFLTIPADSSVVSIIGDTVVVEWDSNTEPDLEGYYVFRNNDPEIFRSPNQTFLAMFDHFPDVGNMVTVVAVDTAGNRSKPSLPVFYRVVASLPPSDECDCNSDGLVDRADWDFFRVRLWSRIGDSLYSTAADINSDGVVNGRDLVICKLRWQ